MVNMGAMEDHPKEAASFEGGSRRLDALRGSKAPVMNRLGSLKSENYREHHVIWGNYV